MNILVTGGAGYIGTHAVVELQNAGHAVTVLDNLSNSSEEALARVRRISGTSPAFVKGDIRDRDLLDRLFADTAFDAVMHFAGLKAVGESMRQPLRYIDNNVGGTITLCQAMDAAGVRRIVFSSSATVYGDPETVPIAETAPIGEPTNPYGRSKLMVEQVLRDLSRADERWSVALLRYFNPVGAHESGLIGEDPLDTPNNLMPYVAQVAVGRLQKLSVFGDDYPTDDGTGVRDYIHVVDLVLGHLRALEIIAEKPGVHIWNLGTGQGYSVLQMIRAFEAASGRRIPYEIAPRRDGDIAACYADPTRAAQQLGWTARHDLARMMQDTWRWQQQNPQGYRGE
ncbi:UDP-glucose 4-epimerase [Natronocella acetinitrilica]|uniref:UDP-glucose 4-epimerase n=1 Tax=Natronocella acetinitrilica TaxID=414046 RepID=A0AAE3KA98_9GAMM|nr:UDP-glucose 4-epimerase GalE [Natronocella acetinitrilica]MCP1673970.1 UDP-glucose 4-epimerase [Natronocella acetinitrilica]